MKRACVIGWPIKHSRSPLIHGFWLKQHDIQGTYTKEAVQPAELDAFLRTLAERGLSGCNVTVPHKEEACRICLAMGGQLHDDAAVVGAANTLWLDEGGRLHATSTDGYGFMAHLRAECAELELRGHPVMVLGAGGAAQSIIWSLSTEGPSEIRVANRSLVRAEQMRRLQRAAPISVVPWEDRSQALRDCRLLVNTTTLGMSGQPALDISLDLLPAVAIVYDIVYVPLQTDLLKAARARGLRAVDGLGMLLHQAVPGFERWFGVRPKVTAELRALVVQDIEAGAC